MLCFLCVNCNHCKAEVPVKNVFERMDYTPIPPAGGLADPLWKGELGVKKGTERKGVRTGGRGFGDCEGLSGWVLG